MMMMMMKIATLLLSGWMMVGPPVAVLAAMVDPPTTANTVPVEYTHEETALLGHLSIPQDGDGPFPAIIVIPDWGKNILSLCLFVSVFVVVSIGLRFMLFARMHLILPVTHIQIWRHMSTFIYFSRE
jgi:hypothetical protein